jgi:hypothetical protein
MVVSVALRRRRRLPTYASEAMRYYCATGVFMEYNMDPPAVDISTVTPHYPCDTPMPYPPACYRYEGQKMMRAAGGHADRFAQECMTLLGGQRLGCFLALGSANIAAIAKEPALLAELASMATSDDQTMSRRSRSWRTSTRKAERACARPCGSNRVRDRGRGGLYRLDRVDWSVTRP